MTASVERVGCYVCGSSGSTPWGEENGWKAVRCNECGLIYVNPRPTLESISRAAQTGMHAGDVELDVVGAYDPGKRDFYRGRLGALYEPGFFAGLRGRWLDIGCGFGEFLEALGEQADGALTLVGSEPNEKKAASARARGLDVAFLDLDRAHEPFRGISLLNVYGHLPDPPKLIRRLCELLMPEGELLLQTGNWAELERGQIPDHLSLPDHLSFGSEDVLRRVLKDCGFTTVRVGRFDMFPNKRWLLKRARRVLRLPSRQTTPDDLWFRALKTT